MHDFRVALSSHAIKLEFEYLIEKSDPGRCRAFCGARYEGCKWRLHASKMGDHVTVKVKKNAHLYTCKSSRRHGKVKGTTKRWVAEKVKDWLVENNKLGPKELQTMIKEKYKVEVHYKRVCHGKELALNQLYGNWQESFDNVYRFKAQIEQSSPDSLVVIDHHTINKRIREQLCIACAVDGYNWMYPVAVGVIDSETNENWNSYKFEKHYKAMAQARLEAAKWLQENHTKLWTRSQFSTLSKVDYVTNNLVESCNHWVKAEKGKHLDDLLDTIRQKMLIKWNIRKRVAKEMNGKILDHITKKHTEQKLGY
ncbi:hypothetical protein U9M48_012100 [Paspalum notatum var. saurae]|uniref:Transposase MuDR plant domain-containing protein n=1 Tax=Paspalum notatum var. saurae TaxID=547442 RepID=A0AAQ3SWV4_PASNO